MSKVHLNLSFSSDTRDRLQQYAADHHTTISQAITTWIWAQRVTDTQVRGQMTLDEVLPPAEKPKRRKPKTTS